jgi:hypothetical protein
VSTGGTTAGAAGTGGMTESCSCAGSTTTWECFCQAFDCTQTLVSMARSHPVELRSHLRYRQG